MKFRLAFLALACSIGAQEMVSLRVKVVNNPSKNNYLEYVRCGHRRTFSSTPIDSLGGRSIVYAIERQAWLVDGPSQSGRLLEDNGATFDMYLPIFGDSQTVGGKEYVEWGREFDHFKKSKKTETQRAVLNGITYAMRIDSVPRSLVVMKGSDTVGNYRYEKYRTSGTCDQSKFVPPAAIDFSKSASADLDTILLEWSLPSEKKSFTAFTNRGVVTRMNLMSKSAKPASEMPMLGFFAGMIKTISKDELADLNHFADSTREEYGSKVFRLAQGVDPSKLWTNKIREASEFDFCWGHYYATRNLQDIKLVASAFATNDSTFIPELTISYKDRARNSAAWSLQSHLKLLPFFRQDLEKVLEETKDPGITKVLKSLLMPSDIQRSSGAPSESVFRRPIP